MQYQPVTHKFVAVLNKKVPVGNLMNALGHMTAGLVAANAGVTAMRFQDYHDADGGTHPSISDNPFIVLQADNSNKLRGFRQALIDAGIPFTDFTSTMVEGTYAEQHDRTYRTLEPELEYWGVATFGEAERIGQLTKKFSLWRG